jgi:hypothetical protein
VHGGGVAGVQCSGVVRLRTHGAVAFARIR